MTAVVRRAADGKDFRNKELHDPSAAYLLQTRRYSTRLLPTDPSPSATVTTA